jgi:hypothetical protein
MQSGLSILSRMSTNSVEGFMGYMEKSVHGITEIHQNL